MTRILLWTFLVVASIFALEGFQNTGISVLFSSSDNMVFASDQTALQAQLTMSSVAETDSQNDLEGKNVKSFLSVITSYVLMASMFIAVTMFIYGSYQLFTSEWDPKKHSEAIKGMIYAGIAFLIISFSYTLVEVASRFQI